MKVGLKGGLHCGRVRGDVVADAGVPQEMQVFVRVVEVEEVCGEFVSRVGIRGGCVVEEEFLREKAVTSI